MDGKLMKTLSQQIAFDGKVASLIELRNASGMSIIIMDIGASWVSCVLPLGEEKREVLLGTATLEDFQAMSSYMGVTAGRFANRIANGQFEIDGQVYQLLTNHAGSTLHGGPQGIDKHRWTIVSQSQNQVQLYLKSPDGDQGFPGNLEMYVTYQLSDDNQVIISYKASSDKATPVNLTNHAYFNLYGESSGKDCLGHLLQIDADHYLPINENGIPTGSLATVTDTGFDFRQPKRIGQDLLLDEQQQQVSGYDHSFFLNQDAKAGKRSLDKRAAVLKTADDQVMLEVYTNKPAIQLYTGNWHAGEKNRCGEQYSNYAGVALETQFLPDSPNHPEWPQESVILRPGHEYCYQTRYGFRY